MRTFSNIWGQLKCTLFCDYFLFCIDWTTVSKFQLNIDHTAIYDIVLLVVLQLARYNFAKNVLTVSLIFSLKHVFNVFRFCDKRFYIYASSGLEEFSRTFNIYTSVQNACYRLKLCKTACKYATKYSFLCKIQNFQSPAPLKLGSLDHVPPQWHYGCAAADVIMTHHRLIDGLLNTKVG